MNTHTTFPQPAQTDLCQFKINGVSLFNSHVDSADQRLTEAFALLNVITAAFDHAEDDNNSETCKVTRLRAGIIARALDGVSTLIALSQFHTETAADQRSRRG